MPRELEVVDPEAASRARLLLFSVAVLFTVNTGFLIAGVLVEKRSLESIATMLALNVVYLATPFVLRRTASVRRAALPPVLGVIVSLGVVAWDNGGFVPLILPFIGAIPLLATFFLGVRLGVACSVLVAIELTGLWILDRAGYPFPEPAYPEARDYFVLAAAISGTALVAVLGLLWEHSRRRALDLANRRLEELQDVNAKLTRLWDEARAGSHAKTEFIANVSHELRTPMNGVLGMTGLLLDTNLTNEQRDYAETIVTSAQSLLLLINELLDTAKIEAGKLELTSTDFELLRCIEDTMSLLAERAHQKNLELVYLVDPDVPAWVEGDPVRLRQVMTNLVHNAIKFTERGEVVLTVSLAEPGNSESLVRFAVRDTGIGIAPDVQSRLFEPFVQADASMTKRYEGTGLGLAIAKNLVELMGGRIGVDSERGRGSTFWFTAKFNRQWSAREDSLSLVSVLLGRRALVVDDSAAARRIVTEQLSSLGFVVDGASGGREALVKLEEGLRTELPHAVVVADVAMPDMDGVALVRALKTHPLLGELPIVLLSPLSLARRRREALALGASAYVTKPVRRLQLADRLAAALTHATAGNDEHPTGAVVSPVVAANARRRILLVEDNEVNSKVTARQLQKLGYEVDAVGTGREAVTAVRRADWDAVLMDCQMPDVDGFEATRQIRRFEGEERHTVIIAMTAGAMIGDRERCARAGMDDFLAKPVRLEELRETLFRWTAYKRDDAEPGQAEPRPPVAASRSDGAVASTLDPRTLGAEPIVVAKGSDDGAGAGRPVEVAAAGAKDAAGPPPDAGAGADVTEPPLDPEAFGRLEMLCAGDAPGLLDELIDIFLRDARSSCALLRAAADRSDKGQVEYVAHKLVSGCGNLGAKRMARLCRELEDEAKRDHPDDLRKPVSVIEAELARVLAALEARRGRAAHTSATAASAAQEATVTPAATLD
ncbi:response regulator [Myxococcota bacterium]|nr:response regulator [Myxococcota bacterium]